MKVAAAIRYLVQYLCTRISMPLGKAEKWAEDSSCQFKITDFFYDFSANRK